MIKRSLWFGLLSAFILATAFTLVVPAAQAERDIGLVLSGGGARGAYEVGVWRAMCECGLADRVRAISGTSVGGINGALFATVPDPDTVIRFWRESLPEAFVLNPQSVSNLFQRVLSGDADFGAVEATADRLLNEKAAALRIPVSMLGETDRTDAKKEAWGLWRRATVNRSLSEVGRHLGLITNSSERIEGFADSASLRRMIDERLPANKWKNAPDVYVTAVEKNEEKTWRVFHLNGEPRERQLDMMLASAGIPFIYDTPKIDGKTYMDGGIVDNTPVGPILKNHPEVKILIVVHLTHDDHSVRRFVPAEFKFIEIRPSKNIGGTVASLNFSKEKAEELFELGYEDAKKALEGL